MTLELAIYEDESQMKIFKENYTYAIGQIKKLEADVERLKKVILDSMTENGIKVVEVAGMKFNRISPNKKVLRQTEAELFLREHDLIGDYMTLDTKRIQESFPQFVTIEDGTEYLKITEVKNG